MALEKGQRASFRSYSRAAGCRKGKKNRSGARARQGLLDARTQSPQQQPHITAHKPSTPLPASQRRCDHHAHSTRQKSPHPARGAPPSLRDKAAPAPIRTSLRENEAIAGGGSGWGCVREGRSQPEGSPPRRIAHAVKEAILEGKPSTSKEPAQRIYLAIYRGEPAGSTWRAQIAYSAKNNIGGQPMLGGFGGGARVMSHEA
jgi:hypothetical protein